MKTALPPMHPGELLREDILPDIPLSKSAIADRLGISRQTLHDILGERKPVTVNIALRLARLLGASPRFWLNLQTAYDIEIEGLRLAPQLELIEPLPKDDAESSDLRRRVQREAAKASFAQERDGTKSRPVAAARKREVPSAA